MSTELREYLNTRGIASSRTTAYNPTGNSQGERYNGIIWKSIEMAIDSKQLQLSQWERILPDVLHSIRSLLCTTTNETPHDRFLRFSRRSSSGQSLPQWFTQPGNVLMKRHVRNSKYDPKVDEVELLYSNIDYAHVRLPDGRETTVSTKHLAPAGDTVDSIEVPLNGNNVERKTEPTEDNDSTEPSMEKENGVPKINSESDTDIRRSSRIKKCPERFGFE